MRARAEARQRTYFYDRTYAETIPAYPNESVVVFVHRYLRPGQHVLDLGWVANLGEPNRGQ